jgi:hypothetical protein
LCFRSGSMSCCDRGPLADAPMTNRIRQIANNRLGAVYSALHGFWSARHAAVTVGNRSGVGARRDAYSVILFNSTTTSILTNDFTSTPDQLLNAMLAYGAGGGTNFSAALRVGGAVMEQNWSTERFVSWSSVSLRRLLLIIFSFQNAGDDLPF